MGGNNLFSGRTVFEAGINGIREFKWFIIKTTLTHQDLLILVFFLYFFLDKKVTKNQDEKMLLPSLLVLFIF
jgi:hypothetical protein